MQLSVKTPPGLTMPILEKCAVLNDLLPSQFVANCTFQCLKWMDLPHTPFHPLALVEAHYHALGRETEIMSRSRVKDPAFLEKLIEDDRGKRGKLASQRLKKLRGRFKHEPPAKHLHLKISEGGSNLPQRIKSKAEWLRLSPNLLVVACVRDSLEAMNEPGKAVLPPPVVVQFWTASNAKLGQKAMGATGAMVLESLERMLRKRSGPILDTMVRLALTGQWDTTLEHVLRDADAITAIGKD